MPNVIADTMTVRELLDWVNASVEDLDAPVVIGVDSTHGNEEHPFDYLSISVVERTGLTPMGGVLTAVVTDPEEGKAYGLPPECIDEGAPEALILWSC